MDVKDLLPEFEKTMADVAGLFDLMGIAEEEIEAAQKRHGEPLVERDENGRVVGETGPIWNSFHLLVPTHELMESEMVYRAHCAELLDRVAASEDTRPGTSPELVLALSDVSKATPVRSWAAGLYLKLFQKCFPEQSRNLFPIDRHVEDYEKLFGDEMAEEETTMRRKLAQEWRK